MGHGPLRFAFAKREITPLPGEPLAGYGERWWKGETCTGATDKLWARALGLAAGDQVVCILGLDLLCVTRDLRERALAALAKKSRLSPDSVLFSATHTHSGPGGYSPELFARPFLGAPCEASRDRIVAAIAESVDEATRPLLEGRGDVGHLSVYRQDAPKLVRNRLLGTDTSVDPSATLIRLESAGGNEWRRSPNVLAVSFGAHATTHGPRESAANGDYPGRLVATLSGPRPPSHVLPRDEALFLAGAVGSQAPRGDDPDGGDPAQAFARSLLLELWRLSDPDVALARTGDVDLAAFEAEIDLPHASPRIGPVRVSPVLAGSQIPSTASLRFLRLGPLVIAAAPGDLSGELSLRAKQALEGPGRVLLPISFSGDYHGYFLPEERAQLPGYEPAMMWHGPEGGELILDALVTGSRAAFDLR